MRKTLNNIKRLENLKRSIHTMQSFHSMWGKEEDFQRGKRILRSLGIQIFLNKSLFWIQFFLMMLALILSLIACLLGSLAIVGGFQGFNIWIILWGALFLVAGINTNTYIGKKLREVNDGKFD